MSKRIFQDDDREAADKAAIEILDWIETFGESYGTGRQRREFLQDIIIKHMRTVKNWTAIFSQGECGNEMLANYKRPRGSTTLWAAEFHNRPWIGIEMNPEYVAIAEARIARERSQIKMAI